MSIEDFYKKEIILQDYLQQKVPELNCNNAEMILNKQCHLPFSLLIGNPGSPVMKVGCSPSTVWKRRKKRTCKIHFSWEELNQFFAPTTSILLSTQKIQPYTLFQIEKINSFYTYVFLMAGFRQSSFEIVSYYPLHIAARTKLTILLIILVKYLE